MQAGRAAMSKLSSVNGAGARASLITTAARIVAAVSTQRIMCAAIVAGVGARSQFVAAAAMKTGFIQMI